MDAIKGGIRWGSAVWAGLISGAVFLVLEMAMVPMFLGNPMWAPPRMIAAIGMGKDVLPPPATFDLGIVMVAMLIHFALSIVFALVLAAIVHRMGAGMAVVAGAVFGLILYFVNFYGFTAVFPWFAMPAIGYRFSLISCSAVSQHGSIKLWWHEA